MSPSAADGERLGERLREHDLSAAAAVLNLVESRAPADQEAIVALLEATSPRVLGGEPPAHVVGITGPPGVGSDNTELSRLCQEPC